MINFCKKIIQNFLSLSNSKDPQREISQNRPNIPHSPIVGGLSLIILEIRKPLNVLESTTVKSPVSAINEKKDSGRIGFFDGISNNSVVNGLMSCTESLGFESSDERRKDNQMEKIDEELRTRSNLRSKWKNTVEKVKKREKKFPPPLPSLNKNGQPNFYLKSVRKDGRLELTEIRIDRPEILRASRQDGRLKLQFVRSEIQNPFQEEEEIEMERVEEESGVCKFEFPLPAGDSFRRCQEQSNPNHHYNHHYSHLPLWSHRFVTTS